MLRGSLAFLRRRWLMASLVVAWLGAALIIYLVFFHGPHLTKRLEWSPQSGGGGQMIFTPDGKTLICGGGDPISLWNPTTGRLKRSLSTYDASSSYLTVSPGGNMLACTRVRRARKQPDHLTFELWDIRTGTRIAELDEWVSTCAFSPTGATIATISIVDPYSSKVSALVQLRSLPGLTPLARFPAPFPTTALAFSPDGKTLAVGEQSSIELFDVATLLSIRTFKGAFSSTFAPITFYPDGKTLAAIGEVPSPSTAGLSTWDVATGRLKQNVDFGHGATEATFSGDGHTVAVHLLWYGFGRSDRIEIWDTARGSKLCSLTDRRRWISTIALSPDATHLVVGYQSPAPDVPGPLTVWRIE